MRDGTSKNICIFLALLLGSIGCHSKSEIKSSVDLPIDSQRQEPISQSPTVQTPTPQEAISEADWMIECCARTTGALTVAPQGAIIPYSANRAAMSLLIVGEKYHSYVRKYMEWYFKHLNKPDHLGVQGTIYDYEVVEDTEKSKNDYDSSDAYAATFLSLAKAYLITTKDRNFIQSHLEELKLIVGAVDKTLQENGLTHAKPNWSVAYLMDNVEVWNGYGDFAELLETLGEKELALNYRLRAEKVRNAIEKHLWSPQNSAYLPALGNNSVNWNQFYTDAAPNLWPILFELPEALIRKELLYKKFLESQPKWVTLEADFFPWVSLALVAKKMGDVDTLSQFVTKIREKLFPKRGWPWNIYDSGWYIRLAV